MFRLCNGLAGGALLVTLVLLGLTTTHARQPAVADTPAMPGGAATSGYTLHIDAGRHFPAHPSEIAHHWCKTISPTLIECQLYDTDSPNARLVGVETIVPTAVWQTFSPQEQALWHSHKTQLKKIQPTLPDTPENQRASVIAALEPTYGKVYILWDPISTKNPTGQPSITVLK